MGDHPTLAAAAAGRDAAGGALLTAPLLGADDPAPVERVKGSPTAPYLLLADHAGFALPQTLGDLGLTAAQRRLHIAGDIGIAELTRALARRLEAPAILGRYSRLAIDLNRAPDDPTAFAQESDGHAVPGNRGLTGEARRARLAEIFEPYHRAVAAAIAAAPTPPALISLHSFTPSIGGFARPWHVGILSDRDRRLADPMLALFRAEGDLVVGDNQPYDMRSGQGYCLARHAAASGLAHLLIEIRQDLIEDRAGAEAWAGRLAKLLRALPTRERWG